MATCSAEWFHGDLSREQSMQRLLHFPVGGFLVRGSSKPGCFSLDLVTTGGNFLPMLVQQAPEHGAEAVRLAAGPGSGLEARVYASLEDMVRTNAAVLLYPCNSTATTTTAAAAAAPLPVPLHVELREEGAHKEGVFNAFQTETARGFGGPVGAPKLNREGSEEGEMLMASGGPGNGGRSKREGDEECQFLMASGGLDI